MSLFSKYIGVNTNVHYFYLVWRKIKKSILFMENGFFVSLYNGFHRETPYIIRDFTMKTNVEKITKIVNVIVIF